ncbi:MAG: uracil phosphoribosyltransferase [Cytophagales bacterium]|nr:MAG: uracil phosphoribosyltransferase [Cytophagales bacterium]
MFVLTQQNTIANHFLAELRSREMQKDRHRFRHNLERLGEILAYELSKELDFQPAKINTPLGVSATNLLSKQPVLVCVMRAGLPFYQGFQTFFAQAESAFIGAFRGKPNADHEFEIEMHYAAIPDLDGKPLIIIDPMLATGKSIVSSYQTLLQYGMPSQIHIAAVIASRDGVNHLLSNIPYANLWIGDIDEELNHKFYIVPGLGDAGDLAFGEKI